MREIDAMWEQLVRRIYLYCFDAKLYIDRALTCARRTEEKMTMKSLSMRRTRTKVTARPRPRMKVTTITNWEWRTRAYMTHPCRQTTGQTT